MTDTQKCARCGKPEGHTFHYYYDPDDGEMGNIHEFVRPVSPDAAPCDHDWRYVREIDGPKCVRCGLEGKYPEAAPPRATPSALYAWDGRGNEDGPPRPMSAQEREDYDPPDFEKYADRVHDTHEMGEHGCMGCGATAMEDLMCPCANVRCPACGELNGLKSPNCATHGRASLSAAPSEEPCERCNWPGPHASVHLAHCTHCGHRWAVAEPVEAREAERLRRIADDLESYGRDEGGFSAETRAAIQSDADFLRGLANG